MISAEPVAVEPDAIVEDLAARGVPEPDLSLVRGLPAEERRGEGIPSADDLDRRIRAELAVLEVLGQDAVAGLATGPLGVGWCSDLDLHVSDPPDPEALRAAGWLSLDGLVAALGSPDRHQWAVTDDGEVLARLDVHVGPVPATSPLVRVLDRCQRDHEVRIREVIEARSLVRAGATIPPSHPAAPALLARDAALGGPLRDAVARSPAAGQEQPSPRRPRTTRLAGRAWRRVRRRRLILALSGPDGAGKSTAARGLCDDLDRLGIPAHVVWTRPGMRPGVLAVLARVAKRLTRQPIEPGIRAVGRGEGTDLASRRGVIGWAWALLLTLSFIVDVRRRTAGRRGVVIFDRHRLDAQVTLEVVYPGVDTRLAAHLASSLLPRASRTVLLDVDAQVARERKPDDLFEVSVLHDQVTRYRAAAVQGRTVVVDASRPSTEVRRRVLRALLDERP